MKERRDADVDGIPQGRGTLFLQLAPKNLDQLSVVARERSWVDLNPI